MRISLGIDIQGSQAYAEFNNIRLGLGYLLVPVLPHEFKLNILCIVPLKSIWERYMGRFLQVRRQRSKFYFMMMMIVMGRG